MVKNTDATPNEAIIVTLGEAKAQLRLEADFTDDDVLIQGFIEAAQAEAQQYTSRPAGQTLVLELNSFDGPIEVDCLPDSTEVVCEYLDSNDEYQGLDPEFFTFRKKYNGNIYELKFKSTADSPLPDLPVSDAAVQVTITSEAPMNFKQWILLYVDHLYEKRGDENNGGAGISYTLLRGYKTRL